MKVAVIGCGVMGTAFARHFAKKKQSLILSDHHEAKAKKLAKELRATFQADSGRAAADADVILLAMKPKDLADTAKAIAPHVTEKKIIVSILAGPTVQVLKSHFPKATIVRTMPNLALIYGHGVMGIVDNNRITPAIRQKIDKLFEGIGLVAWMPEDKIEPLTAISGSGIGFVLVMIEAMIDGGVHLGFSAQEAREFVLKTFEGASALIRESGQHPAELKLQIASPGGTTISGLKAMEEAGVRSGIGKALQACYEKAISMKKINEK